ncbi:MAG: hypothetical protein ACOC4M_13220 [Promethearchaeia archaeon]
MRDPCIYEPPEKEGKLLNGTGRVKNQSRAERAITKRQKSRAMRESLFF